MYLLIDLMFMLLCILPNVGYSTDDLQTVVPRGKPQHTTVLVSSDIKSLLDVERSVAPDIAMQLVSLCKNLNIDLKTNQGKLEILLKKSFDSRAMKEKIVYTSLTIDKRTISLYHYKLQNGKEGYFNSEGISLTGKAFFMKPLGVNYRISSKFGNRKHPIHGRITFHKGVDYAVQSGTPIHAAADGIIEYIGHNGGYGKYIKIKHKNGYTTCYAHMSKFSSNVKLGSKVKQGQVIAYVGSTGAATGPHLHYEVIYNDKHIDPLALKYRTEIKLTGGELAEFKLFVSKINKMVKTL
ncbi:MAG: M23 family metallopeptidase [Wolbachia endosymbiont of Tyrophagus putrescentiae]|nr:M23 family metallopeptidase [Wolbachia endosymbiont of Tyrophagus putrescentiae]